MRSAVWHGVASVRSPDFLDLLMANAPVAVPVTAVAAKRDAAVLGVGGKMGRFDDFNLICLTDAAPPDRSTGSAAAAPLRRRSIAVPAMAGDEARAKAAASYGLVPSMAAARLAEAALRLAEDLEGREAVLTHPYEGGDPDQDACAFAVQAACRLIHRRGLTPPARFEFASHHQRDDRRIDGVFWPDARCPQVVVHLSKASRQAKAAALAGSSDAQGPVVAVPLAVERYRPAPTYDFTGPPPPGACLYDTPSAVLTARMWRDRARAALVKLDLLDEA